MLEQFFVRPDTVDRIRASWIGAAIEQYVLWLCERGSGRATVARRVPILLRFGEFAAGKGAKALEELPAHVTAFVEEGARAREWRPVSDKARKNWADATRNVVFQMLQLALPETFTRSRPDAADREPFGTTVPGFIPYLRNERGLSEHSVKFYKSHLRPFEGYLARIGLSDLASISPVVLSGFWPRAASG